MKIVNDDNINEILDEQLNKTVIKFSAKWCGPCQQIKTQFETIANENSEYNFVEADVDENSELSEKFNIMKIPTIVFVSNGVEVSRINGVFKKSEFEEHLKNI